MEYRTLGGTGVHVSTHCLGTMMFGPWGNDDAEDCARIVRRAIDGGINFVDTADMYSAGRSEEIVGLALKGSIRDDVVLATKFHNPMGPGENQRGNSRVWIMRAVEDSLRRLGTDHIDLYQVHRPEVRPPSRRRSRHSPTCSAQGKIRYFGSSTFPGWQMVEAQWTAERRGLSGFRTEQPPYSIFVRHIEHDVLPVAQELGMGVLVWSPLARGWLTGRYRRENFDESPDARAARGKDRGPYIAAQFDLSRPEIQRKLDLVETLAQDRGGRGRLDGAHGGRLHARPSGGDVGDHRSPDGRAARRPAGRRRRSPGRGYARRDRRGGAAGNDRGRERSRLHAVVVRAGSLRRPPSRGRGVTREDERKTPPPRPPSPALRIVEDPAVHARGTGRPREHEVHELRSPVPREDRPFLGAASPGEQLLTVLDVPLPPDECWGAYGHIPSSEGGIACSASMPATPPGCSTSAALVMFMTPGLAFFYGGSSERRTSWAP